LSDDACKVELHLDFEFTNKLIELAFGKVFKELAGNMVQAFTSACERGLQCLRSMVEVVYALPERQYLRNV
jgi:ribosome-associated toxin RatA of RatAB toxin-antitoxin module